MRTLSCENTDLVIMVHVICDPCRFFVSIDASISIVHMCSDVNKFITLSLLMDCCPLSYIVHLFLVHMRKPMLG